MATVEHTYEINNVIDPDDPDSQVNSTQWNGTAAHALALGADENFVTAAQLVVIGNTSGTNTGDSAGHTGLLDETAHDALDHTGLTGIPSITGLVAKADYNAQTILAATSDDTPAALTVTEQTVVGRVTGGNIAAITIDSDLSSVSASDDTIPSAKATKAMGDLKAPLASPTFTGTLTVPIALTGVLRADAGVMSVDAMTAYPLLAGRSGGQTLIGSTLASGNLTLRSTSHATKGKILFGNPFVALSAYDEANNSFGIGTASPGTSKLYINQTADVDATLRVDAARTLSGANTIAEFYNSGVLRTRLRALGIQDWYLNSSAGEVGTIGFSTPDGSPGILISNLTGRVTFQQNKTDHRLVIGASATGTSPEQVTLLTTGNVGIGEASPTAYLHIKAGTASENTAPLKFTSGTVNTTPEAGTMEYNNTPHFTNSDATRRHIALAPNTTKVTAGAPYTNDGYVVINIGGTDFKVMTTA